MKKYLMTGIAALAIGAAFVSCSHEIEQLSQEELQQYEVQKIKSNYEQAFTKVFGIANNRDNWGFSDANTRTRANAVINGDPFTFEDTENYYKSDVPSTAKKVDDFVRADWGGQIDENAMQGAEEFYLPEGTYSLHLWMGQRDIYVEGNVILNATDASSINQARIYVLPHATFTLNMSNYINNLEIYVAANATLNYNCEYLYKQTGGGKIYNRGTVNFLKDDFQVNQDAIVYNEGAVYAKNITSAPGTGHPSFFYNFANLTLTGKMELNSCANFFNEGTVTVAGETIVTQKDIWWINKGHYTTSSMEFSAWNKTFYNYCQLIVTGEAYMHDGQFTLMDNSYTEVGSAKMNNFAVNMGSNTGMYIKGNLRLLGQGDITYQGFRTEGTNDYLLVDGKATVDCHRYTFSISSGITYSINAIEIIRGINNEVVTEQQLQDEQSGDLPVLDLKGTECPYGELSVTPNTNSCGATWNGGGESADLRVMAEDLSAGENGDDFDFNDVVFDVYFSPKQGEAYVMVLAAGGTLPLTVNGTEVHGLFGKNAGTNGLYPMINTHAEDKGLPGVSGLQAQKIQLTGITVNSKSDVNQKVKIEVQKSITTADGVTTQRWIELENTGVAACKIGVSPTINWANERENVNSVCTFNQWVAGGKLEPTYPNN